MHGAYPFGERVDDDFAVSSKSESDAEWLVESDKVLVEVDLECGVTRQCKNPKVGVAKNAHLVCVVVEKARGGRT